MYLKKTLLYGILLGLTILVETNCRAQQVAISLSLDSSVYDYTSSYDTFSRMEPVLCITLTNETGKDIYFVNNFEQSVCDFPFYHSMGININYGERRTDYKYWADRHPDFSNKSFCTDVYGSFMVFSDSLDFRKLHTLGSDTVALPWDYSGISLNEYTNWLRHDFCNYSLSNDKTPGNPRKDSLTLQDIEVKYRPKFIFIRDGDEHTIRYNLAAHKVLRGTYDFMIGPSVYFDGNGKMHFVPFENESIHYIARTFGILEHGPVCLPPEVRGYRFYSGPFIATNHLRVTF